VSANSTLKHPVVKATILINAAFSENEDEEEKQQKENMNNRVVIKLAEVLANEVAEEIVEDLQQYTTICVLLYGKVSLQDLCIQPSYLTL
jgi:hypothetical protein